MSFSNTAMIVAKKGEFFFKKNGPSIMTYVGVGGFVATVGLAIRATTKMDEVAPKLRQQVEEVKLTALDEGTAKKEYSENLARVYFDIAKQAAKIYGPTFATGTVSILLVLGGHGMMVKRQAQMAALYTAVDASYKAYRARVREELGAEKELDLYRRPPMRAVDEIGEDGEPVEGSDTTMIDPDGVNASPYARFFDESSVNWRKTPEYNFMFLKSQEKWANDRLTAVGYLFLNEVYEALGLERSQTGQIVGWLKKKTGDNDGFVSFGIENIHDDNSRAFVNGYENVVMLDFNVDGPIGI
jgi:hypothetical protein